MLICFQVRPVFSDRLIQASFSEEKEGVELQRELDLV